MAGQTFFPLWKISVTGYEESQLPVMMGKPSQEGRGSSSDSQLLASAEAALRASLCGLQQEAPVVDAGVC